MIAVIWCAKTRELFSIRHPVEVTTIYYYTTHLRCSSIHVLGGRMSYDVSSPFKRTAIDRSGKSIVNNQWNTIFVGDAGKLLDIKNGTSRVADGFAEDNLGVRTECFLDFFLAIVRIDEGAFYAEFLECYTEEVEGATINLIGSHDMVASFADIENCIEVGSLTATCQHSTHATFKLCYFLRYSIIGRVLKTGIEISFFLKIEEHSHLFRIVILKCCTLNDRHFNRLTILWLIASLYTDGSCT